MADRAGSARRTVAIRAAQGERSVRQVHAKRCVLLVLMSASLPVWAACPALVADLLPGHQAEAAGLAPGDCLLAWRDGAGARTAFPDALAALELEYDRALQGQVAVQRRRDGHTRWVRMATAQWGMQVLPGNTETLPSSAGVPRGWTEEAATGRDAVAITLWQAARIGREDPAAADRIYLQALARTDIDIGAHALLHLARCMHGLRALLPAVAHEACAAATAAMAVVDWPGGELRARLSEVSVARNEARNAQALRLLDAVERDLAAVAPRSLLQVSVLYERGVLLRAEGRLDAALATLLQGQALLDQLRGADRQRLSFLGAIGLLQRARGELDTAQTLLEAAVALSERLGPESIQLARDLNNLALLQWDRSNLAQALRTLGRSLAIKRGHGAAASDIAPTLANMALVAIPLGRLDEAERYCGEAAEMFRAQAPSIGMANNLSTAGRIAVARGDRAAAYRDYAQALAIFRTLAPDSMLEAWVHHFQSELLAEDGRTAEAIVAAQHAVALQRQISPGGRDLSFGLHGLAGLLRDQGEFGAAARSFDEAIALRRRHSPDSVALARSLHGAGTVAAARGDPPRARALYCEAVAVLERQRWRWSQDRDDLLELGQSNAEIYRACAVAWLDDGHAVEAFDILEQGRARLLLDSMSRHRDELVARLPEEIARQWRELQQHSDGLSAQVLSERHRALQAQVQALAPAQAALLLARPLHWTQLRTRIADDTAILSQLHDGPRFWIVVARRGLAVPAFIRVADSTAIAARAQALMAAARSPSGSSSALDRDGRWLYRQLVAPAHMQLGGARRLLIVPEAELSLLPFAALVGADGRYLIETHALRQTPSLSTAAIQRAPRAARADEPELLAIADPGAQSLAGIALARWRSADLPAALPALPGAAAEARDIGRLYGSKAHVLLGGAATEKAVRSLAGKAHRLHFAVHGLIDPLRPLDSALVLAPGSGSEDDDGLLLARDLIVDLRLDAELVAVSACDLGGGRVYPGEGLIGLRHALHAAGAGEVISSLWPVADQAGARLMTQFYRDLQRGRRSDRALAQAQRSLIDSAPARTEARRGVGGLVVAAEAGTRTHPFYWAGFVLDGGLW